MTDAGPPLVSAGGRAARSALNRLPAQRVHIGATSKQTADKRDFFRRFHVSVLLCARIACRRFTKNSSRMRRFPRVAMLFQQAHQAGIFSPQGKLFLLNEIALSETIHYFSHRKSSSGGMARVDVTKEALTTIRLECPIGLIGNGGRYIAWTNHKTMWRLRL